MNQILRAHAEKIVRSAVDAVKPDASVRKILLQAPPKGNVYLVAVGKAAWKMAEAALQNIPQGLKGGIVVTKYAHAEHPLENIICYEAGHPVPDENGIRATQAVLDMTENLTAEDTVLFLLSGGGSALFEKPLVSLEHLQEITGQLLACGADIVEINTIRKRLSAVKGGKFAQWCAPAKVTAIVLSDILGDPLDMIASGPAAPDASTCEDALRIVGKYNLKLHDNTMALLQQETPKVLDNVESHVIGSVRQLCKAAEEACAELGYTPVFLTDQMCCEAREAGSFLASVLKSHASSGKNLAFLAGGETVVRLTGKGLGGRNQEIALAAAEGIAGLPNAALISIGSDGTDGPTDAAGGYVDADTYHALLDQGIYPAAVLTENDAYHALKAVDCLIFTGPTGTNVNDITVALLGSDDAININLKG